ncbi:MULTISPECIES: hypothetical protein [unclassified Bradyrhizobium]|uniref:hypothetical protein n=1 Tax=unclassified Bradyrhizobium TaxID=2631580 RepID=UPI001FF8E587|nr:MULTISPECIES: hypothetical protein [unclassified Bradyrhizobium]MCK1707630.1 hypothetical protein [Bradyrhizobium sp. 143]MCK1724841.1 hypothetical protein [Bradyrhizobium sp. 142]
MKARKTPDPLKVFMNAERFRIADLVLRGSQDQRVAVAVASPALVLSAFASELYLKCLILIQSARLEHGHDLHPLFKKLESQSQRRVEQKWNEWVSSPERKRIYEALKKISGESIPTDLDWSLRNGGTGFVDMRYLHEVETGPRFLIGDLPQILREETLQHRPEWTSLGHGPMTPVPGFENPMPNNMP